MSTRRFRPGFHTHRYRGSVPPARCFELPKRIVKSVIPLVPMPGINIYTLSLRSGTDLQIYGANMAEARMLADKGYGGGWLAIAMHHGEFTTAGFTVRVRNGHAIL